MSDKKIYLDSVLAYREDTLENWEYSNPVLERGEVSIVRNGVDGNWLKIGDGVTAWNDLPYKKGPKGEQGPRGERGEQGLPGKDGNNYILTVDDKEEIAGMAKGNVDQVYNPESENAQSGIAVAEASNYKQLFNTIEVTQEDVDAAGQDGITILTIGSEDVDLSRYNDIVIKCYIPQSDTLNTEVGRCFVALTENKNYSVADKNVFLRIQSTTAIAVFTHNKANVISFRGVWCNDNFLFGQSMKNGVGTSHGLQNWQECWISVAKNFLKSQKKYFHITGGTSLGNCNFKFPVGTTVSIYGR